MLEKLDLINEYEKFKKLTFPLAPTYNNNRVDDIFCELVLLDSHVASVIDKILNKRKVHKNDFDFGLEGLIKTIIEEEDHLNKKLLVNYLIYIEELKKLIAIAEVYKFS